MKGENAEVSSLYLSVNNYRKTKCRVKQVERGSSFRPQLVPTEISDIRYELLSEGDGFGCKNKEMCAARGEKCSVQLLL